MSEKTTIFDILYKIDNFEEKTLNNFPSLKRSYDFFDIFLIILAVIPTIIVYVSRRTIGKIKFEKGN